MDSPRILLWWSTFRWPKVTPLQNKVNGFRPLFLKGHKFINFLKIKYLNFDLKGPSPQTGPSGCNPQIPWTWGHSNLEKALSDLGGSSET